MLAEEKARVVSVQDGQATLELEAQACCGSCGLCRAFGGGMRLDVEAVEGLKPGQTVVVAQSRGGSLMSVFLLFGLPLIGLVAGVLLGRVWMLPGLTSDGSSVLLGVAGMGAAFLVAVMYDRKFAGKSIPRPVIVKIEHGGSAKA